jgi:hypothetical protein
MQEEPKQETLEEAAKEFVLSHDFSLLTNPNHLANRCFQYGAKWQAERMYSEEDMIEFAFDTYYYISGIMRVPFNQLSENKLHVFYNFEQFKKK